MRAPQQISRLKLIYIVVALEIIFGTSAKSQPTFGTNTGAAIQKNKRQCIGLRDQDGWSVGVRDPGNYCIEQNLHQSWPLIEFAHQRVPLSPLISVYGGGVTIDLKGHKLSSTTPINSGVFTDISGDDKILPTTIKNGIISTSKTPAIGMIAAWNLENMRFGRAYGLAASHGDLSKYKPTIFILENLTLTSSQHAIIMQGKRNIIRNCTIIGGNGTVNVYGPNLLFEGNTIILNAQTPKTQDDEKPVALYLEDAADSVVRNNKIVIKGAGASNANAIVLVNSPNVLLEHNTVRGTKDVYKLLDEHSSVRTLDNEVK